MKCPRCASHFCDCPPALLTPGMPVTVTLHPPRRYRVRGAWGGGIAVRGVVDAVSPERVRVRFADGRRRWVSPANVREENSHA